MKEHGLYVLKSEFFNLVQSLGGDCDKDGGGKRPVYCCLKDSKIEGLYWAIPTSDLFHRNKKQNDKYSFFMSLDAKDLRSCYYHKSKTTVDSLYKISSCFPITEKYVSHEFTTSGVHVVMQRKDDIVAIEKKLKRILAFEFRKTNYFPQRITDIRNALVNELANLEQTKPKSFEVENPDMTMKNLDSEETALSVTGV